MNTKLDSPIDQTETLIAMALCANQDAGSKGFNPQGRGSNRNGEVWQASDAGELLRFDAMTPSSSYTVDMSDDNRIYAGDNRLLLAHPGEIIGDNSEIMVLDDSGTLKWMGFRRIPRLPRGAVAVGKYSHAFEYHFRMLYADGTNGSYMRRLVLLNKEGNGVQVKVRGCFLNGGIEALGTTIAASIIEDAHRKGAMLASVSDSVEIKFPVPLDDYKEVFSHREGPLTPSGRRRSIIHWVSKHLRSKQGGGNSTVKRHVRGISSFTVDGLSVQVTPNDEMTEAA